MRTSTGTASVSDRRFEIGDEVVALEPLHRVQPGEKGKVFNVSYGDGKHCCLSIIRCPEDHLQYVSVHWDCGVKMGIKFHWTFNKIKVTGRKER
jgi:hypothetical protein